MTIGQKVHYIRKQRGMTQTELSEKAGIKQATISAIENGRNQPTTPTLELLAKALECPLSEFFQEIGTQPSPASITADEWSILEIYRQLNETGKSRALDQMRILLSYPDMRKDESIAAME